MAPELSVDLSRNAQTLVYGLSGTALRFRW